MKSISVDYFLFLVKIGSSYEGYVDGLGYVTYYKNWGIPPFKSYDNVSAKNLQTNFGYILEIKPFDNDTIDIQHIASDIESINKQRDLNFPQSNKKTLSTLEKAWKWAKDHFEIRGGYELSIGPQVAAGIKKLGYGELNLGSYVMHNISGSYQDGIETIYNDKLELDKSNYVKTKSIGGAYIIGGEFSTRTDTKGQTVYTISIGAVIVGGEIDFTKEGIEDWFFGIDITAKAALIIGAMLEFKLGFSKND